MRPARLALVGDFQPDVVAHQGIEHSMALASSHSPGLSWAWVPTTSIDGGGFQHALLEFARGVLGLSQAGHAETKPDAPLQIITPLSCSQAPARREWRTPGSGAG